MSETIQTAEETRTNKGYDNIVPYQWKPGQSGNPKGRGKGSRTKLAEEFVLALHDDFKVNGKTVIEKVRDTRPADYLRLIAAVIPKEFNIRDLTLDQLTDEDLLEQLELLRSVVLANTRGASSSGIIEATAEEVTTEQSA